MKKYHNQKRKETNCFSLLPLSLAALMHATIFGNVTALVQRMYGARKSVYQTKWRDLKDFAILHSVPKHLKQRMQDYFQVGDRGCSLA